MSEISEISDLSRDDELERPACGETTVKEIYWNLNGDNFAQTIAIVRSRPECGCETELPA